MDFTLRNSPIPLSPIPLGPKSSAIRGPPVLFDFLNKFHVSLHYVQYSLVAALIIPANATRSRNACILLWGIAWFLLAQFLWDEKAVLSGDHLYYWSNFLNKFHDSLHYVQCSLVAALIIPANAARSSNACILLWGIVKTYWWLLNCEMGGVVVRWKDKLMERGNLGSTFTNAKMGLL